MSKTYKANSSVYLGEIGVDSGQILITDPCYIESNLDETKNESGVEKLYSEICEKTLSEDGFGQVMRGWSFATTTTHGDGSYPVIGFTNEDGKIAQILIDFEPEFEDDGEL